LFERDDHFQVATPADAIRAGAKFVIMGRPFTVTDNPLKVAEEVSEGIRFALLERDEL
jgi:orotidine-5'-phosphate decarboxylase